MPSLVMSRKLEQTPQSTHIHVTKTEGNLCLKLCLNRDTATIVDEKVPRRSWYVTDLTEICSSVHTAHHHPLLMFGTRSTPGMNIYL